MSDDTVVTKEVGEHVSRRRSLSRRDMIKRTAVAGAAVAWAVPVVEVLGSRAASAVSATGTGTFGSSSAVTYSFSLANFDSSTITIDYEVGSTQETAVYTVSSTGGLAFVPPSSSSSTKSTVSTDPFGLGINNSATQLSGNVPATDTLESVKITISVGSAQQTQTANPSDQFIILATG